MASLQSGQLRRAVLDQASLNESLTVTLASQGGIAGFLSAVIARGSVGYSANGRARLELKDDLNLY